MKALRLILEECRDPYLNLSTEETILTKVNEGLAESTLRLWINSPSIIIGSYQKADLAVNLQFCRDHKIDVIRRLTGGGAVYHDEGNLNWSFTVKKNEAFLQEVLKPYEYFGSMIANSLCELGFQAKFTVPNRIDLRGKKISGMAGYIKAKAVLFHGTLLVDTDLTVLNSACITPKDAPPVTSLKSEVESEVQVDDIRCGILDFLIKVGVELHRGGLSEGEVELAHNLYSNKYSLPSWNLGSLRS